MIENYTDVKSWSVEDIINSLKDNPPKKEKVIIPKFQRTLVWKDKQRKLLIDSIKKGMPIGAILLYKMGDNSGITEYQLIDGLQRVTTLKRYYEKPTDFYDEENVDDDFVKSVKEFLLNIVLQINDDEVKKYIVEWIRSVNGFEESYGFSSFELASFLDEKIKGRFHQEITKENIKIFVNLLKPYLQKIKEESDISDFKMPVITYTGDKSELPIIFERINSKGTQLNKYQIFAATWSTYEPIEIQNTEIIDKIKAKYEALIDEGLEIENYDPSTFYTTKFTYFEYLFGLGKLLVEKYPLLFKSQTSEHEADSIGFNLVAICVKHNLKRLDTLPETLKKFNLNTMEENLFKAVDFVNRSLKPYIGLKANKKNGSEFPVLHSEFQIVSIIGKVFNSIFIVDEENGLIEKNSAWNSIKDTLQRNIPYHYLYDIIKGYWSGTGDKKAMERAYSDWYENKISKDLWDSLLQEWHENEKNKKEKNRARINKMAVLFLKYIYTHLLTANEELSTTEFEVDHVVPFARLKPIAAQIDGLPISSIGNLALIKKNINRDKRDRTIYEYYNELVTNGEMTQAQSEEKIKEIERYTFTTRDMLSFVNALNNKNINEFYDYLDKRFERMKEKFYELNQIN